MGIIDPQILAVCAAAGFGSLAVPDQSEAPFHDFRELIGFKRSQIVHVVLRLRLISDAVQIEPYPLGKVIGIPGFVGPERARDDDRAGRGCRRVSRCRDQIIEDPEHCHL